MTRSACQMTSADVLQAVGGLHLGAGVRLAGVTTDTRNVQRDDLFVALKGPTFDGHDFVEAAYRAGCSRLPCRASSRVREDAIVVPDTLRALADLAASIDAATGHPSSGSQAATERRAPRSSQQRSAAAPSLRSRPKGT
ncbi:MAG: hypothetical protein HC923_09340 [Myxococcales bacterium]|nr:hypothetical protein [Myxococcales bacterium]